MKFRPNFRLMIDEPGDTGGAGSAGTAEPAAIAPADGAKTDAPAPAAPTQSAAAPAPKSMLEAVSAAIDAPAKPAAADPAKPAVDAAKPAAQAKPGEKPEVKPEDLTKMPEGLSKEGQKRFQQLANANKDLTEKERQVSEKYQQVMESVEPFRKALQDNGIVKEQFDQAASVIGMMNRGDLDGAMKVLNEQMRLISLAMGKPIPAIDALADFPDLRAAVDGMNMTEEVAMQLARGRAQDSGRQAQDRQQTEQRQQQEQQRQTQEVQQKAWDAGLKSVDEFTNKMKSTDLDFAAIEAKLLPRIPALINGVPPAQWAAKVQTLYEMIKDAAGSGRAAPIPTNTLRPTGSASPSQAPKNMHEAMWGTAV